MNALNFIPAMSPENLALLSGLLKTSLVCIAALALSRVIRSTTATTRCNLIRTAFVILAATAILHSLPGSFHRALPSVALPERKTPTITHLPPVEIPPPIETAASTDTLPITQNPIIEETPSTSSTRLPEIPIKTITHTGFAIGLLWLGFRWIAGAWWLRHNSAPAPASILRIAASVSSAAGIRGTTRCHIVHGLKTPLITGFTKPSLWLPSDITELNPNQIDAIMKHEIAHHLRRDLPWSLFTSIITAFWWWNPFVWILRSKLARETEMAADETALSAKASPADLSEVLIRFASATRHRPSLPIGMEMAGVAPIETRIRAILGFDSIGMKTRGLQRTLLVVFGGAGLFLSSLTTAQTPAGSTPQLSENANAIRETLLKGSAPEISLAGKAYPGGLSVFGADAVVLASGVGPGGLKIPVAAASTLGKGKVVVFGHDGFLIATENPGTAPLLVNATRWTSAEGVPLKVGHFGLYRNEGVEKLLQENSIESVALGSDWSSQLDGISVLFLNSIRVEPEDLPALEKFVKNGGGLVTGVTGWGWKQIRQARYGNLQDSAPNQLLSQAGIVFDSSVPGRSPEGGFPTRSNPELNAATALEILRSAADPKADLPLLAQCRFIVKEASLALNEDHPFRKEVAGFVPAK